MALVVYDRVQETTATTGTGTITLGGAVAGFQTFAVVGNGNTTFYCIVNSSQWEVGIGTYSTTGPTLARTTILSNSNGNTSPITLVGASSVFCTYPAEKSINYDADGVATIGSPLSYSDTGVIASFASTVAGYNQVVIQNKSTATDASSNLNVSNDLGDSSGNFAEFGINSSTFTGPGSFDIAGASYLASASTDLTIGTYGAYDIHFVTNSNTTDAMTIFDNGGISLGELDNPGIGNIACNNINLKLQKVTTTGGTTTLTNASPYFTQFTGTSTHTVQLPDATTCLIGTTFILDNDSTQDVTIKNGAGTSFEVIIPGGYHNIVLENNSTIAGTWIIYSSVPSTVEWGTNSLVLGSTVITGGTWQGGTIQPGYGGTGLTTFTAANNALYSTGASTLTAGTLPVAAGGTGKTTNTLNGVVYGNGTSALGVTAAGTTGQVLIATTGSAPSWGSVPTTAAVTSFSAGTTGLTPSTATTGAVTLAGTLAIANGGSGATTAQTAMNTFAGAVTSGSYLRGNGTNVVMSTIQAADVPTLNQNTTGTAAGLSATLVATSGGTGQSSYAVGDLLYASTTTALSKLADVATGNALISGGVSTAPSWGKIGLTTHVSGTLPTANGGTNLTSFTANGVMYASSTSALTTGTALTFDGSVLSATASAAAAVESVFTNSSTSASASAGVRGVGNSTGYFALRQYGTGVTATAFGLTLANYALLFTDGVSSNGLAIGALTADPVIFGTNNAERMRITSNGGIAFGGAANYGTSGQILQSNGDAAPTWVAKPTGTVTSVTGTSPVSVATGTTTPVISLASGYGDTQNPYASKTANTFLAAPNGAAGVPTFRNIVAADIPTLNQNTTGSSGSCTGNSATATLAANTSSISSAVGNSYVWTGVQYFKNTAADNTGTGTSSTLQAYGNGSGGAYMSFHRPGLYAINMGLDSDNVFRIGGWSASANCFQLTGGGAGTFLSTCTATSFSGAGTGLTGTASSLSIGGTAAGLSAVLSIASGGTNSTATPTAGGVGYGTGSAHAYSAAGTSGQVLQSNGSSAPSWRTISYAAASLVVAGGGGGAGIGGGGGAGGVISTASTTLIVGTVYTITVGAGGGAAASGGNSSFVAINAIGGGLGGSDTIAGGNGGSGGGGGRNRYGIIAAGAGTSGQGNNGGNGSTSGGTDGYGVGGGGGGAGAAGTAASGSTTGNGGNGTASSITGTSVTYGGGGGGGGYGGSASSGGTGGGGGFPGGTSSGTAGTANTGGGGAGSGLGGSGGNGGSGVVILSVPTANYSGQTTGSPTITTSGSNTIIKFTSSGTYIA